MGLILSASSIRFSRQKPTRMTRRIHSCGPKINASLRDKKIAATLDTQGIVARPMSAPEYKAFVAAEAEKFGAIVKQANIRAEN